MGKFVCNFGIGLIIIFVTTPLVLAESSVDIGSRLELMVDDHLIENLSGGAEFRLHQPIAREVAITHDEP